MDWEQRREQVKKAMEISWAGYEKYAWGMDGILHTTQYNIEWQPTNGT